MFRRCRILGDFEAAGASRFFTVELAHLIGFHSTYQKFPVVADKADDPETLYFSVKAEPGEDGATLSREGNIVTVVPAGREWDMFRLVDTQYESITGWEESPRRLDLAPEGLRPASDAPEYIHPRYLRATKGLESLYAREFLLEDADKNALTDTENVRFMADGVASARVLKAMCDLACRFGMETTSVTFPLCDPAYEGHRLVFREGEQSAIRCAFEEENAEITVTLGEDAALFTELLSERFPDTGDEKTLLQLLHELRPGAAKLCGNGFEHEQCSFTVDEVSLENGGLALSLIFDAPENAVLCAGTITRPDCPEGRPLRELLGNYASCTVTAEGKAFPVTLTPPDCGKTGSAEGCDVSPDAFASFKRYRDTLASFGRLKALSVFNAGETGEGMPLDAIRLLPAHEGYLSRTKLINKNPCALFIARYEKTPEGVRGLFLALKALLTEDRFSRLTKEMNLILLPLPEKDDAGTVRAVSKVFHRWLPDFIFDTRLDPAADKPAVWGVTADGEAYRSNREVSEALGRALGFTAAPEGFVPPEDTRALTHPWLNAVTVFALSPSAGQLESLFLEAVSFIRSTGNACVEEQKDTSFDSGTSALVRVRPPVASGLYGTRGCETEPFYK